MVKELLQNHSFKIQPGIQRIVWLYKRWQQLYTVIERTVIPRVDFIQRIPADLEDDEFYDPRINNLLILDDLFSESGKDKRKHYKFVYGGFPPQISLRDFYQSEFVWYLRSYTEKKLSLFSVV
jgi:hypothetical protein